MGNTAPWATTGSINQGLHVDESTRQLYENHQLNARIAYNRTQLDELHAKFPAFKTMSNRSVPRSPESSRAST